MNLHFSRIKRRIFIRLGPLPLHGETNDDDPTDGTGHGSARAYRRKLDKCLGRWQRSDRGRPPWHRSYRNFEGCMHAADAITNAARQPFGLLHGGVSMVLAETAASMHACWGVDLTKVVPVGIEINGSHLRSATEGVVLAECRVVRRAQTLIVHEIDIIDEKTGRKLNVSRVTNLYIRSPLAPRGAASDQ